MEKRSHSLGRDAQYEVRVKGRGKVRVRVRVRVRIRARVRVRVRILQRADGAVVSLDDSAIGVQEDDGACARVEVDRALDALARLARLEAETCHRL